MITFKFILYYILVYITEILSKTKGYIYIFELCLMINVIIAMF